MPNSRSYRRHELVDRSTGQWFQPDDVTKDCNAHQVGRCEFDTQLGVRTLYEFANTANDSINHELPHRRRLPGRERRPELPKERLP
jgi:hypothetical protein